MRHRVRIGVSCLLGGLALACLTGWTLHRIPLPEFLSSVQRGSTTVIITRGADGERWDVREYRFTFSTTYVCRPLGTLPEPSDAVKEPALTGFPSWFTLPATTPQPGATPSLVVYDRLDSMYGWPVRCWRQRATFERSMGPTPRWDNSVRILGTQVPVRPMALGMAADAVFYALLIAGARWGFVSVRGSRRRRRALCPGCAYPRASLAPGAPCPECGGSF